MTSQTTYYYRVVSFGAEAGNVARDPTSAWESWERKVRRRFGYDAADLGTARAAHSARLIGPVPRREAEAADVSR